MEQHSDASKWLSRAWCWHGIAERCTDVDEHRTVLRGRGEVERSIALDKQSKEELGSSAAARSKAGEKS
jgi:hypothetical protein